MREHHRHHVNSEKSFVEKRERRAPPTMQCYAAGACLSVYEKKKLKLRQLIVHSLARLRRKTFLPARLTTVVVSE